MSTWKELKKVVNSNFNTPLNEQIKEQLIDMQFHSGQLIAGGASDVSLNWTVPKTGIYKIICVGGGSRGNHNYKRTNGYAGGVVVGKVKLTKGDTHLVTITETESYTGGDATFGDYFKATGANCSNNNDSKVGSGEILRPDIAPGTVYDGNKSRDDGDDGYIGGSVGFYDIKYMAPDMTAVYSLQTDNPVPGGRGLFESMISQAKASYSGSTHAVVFGGNGFGAGGSSYNNGDYANCYASINGSPGCVYIELVHELEE